MKKNGLAVFLVLVVAIIFVAECWAVPPRVTNLSAVATGPYSFRLEWITPAGVPLEIDARWSYTSITALNWASCSQISGEPTPVATTNQSTAVTVPKFKTTYYAAVKVRDASGWSLVSNVAITITFDSVATVTLTWDPNSETDLAGYKIYRGSASRTYDTNQVLGEVTTAKFFLNRGWTYYFAATAFNDSGLESGFSNEVVYTAPSQ
jgi:hypothetical protein